MRIYKNPNLIHGESCLGSEGVRLARSATYIAIQGIVSGLSGIFYFAFAARLLPTVADLGRVSALTMFSSLLATLFLLSLPSAITKYFAEGLGRGGHQEANRVALTGLKVGSSLALIGSGLCLVLAPQLSSVFLGSECDAFFFRLLAIDSFALILAPFVAAALGGAQQFKELSMISVSSSVIRSIGAVILLLFGLGISGIIIAWILGDFLYLFLAIFFYRRLVKGAEGGFPIVTMVR